MKMCKMKNRIVTFLFVAAAMQTSLSCSPRNPETNAAIATDTGVHSAASSGSIYDVKLALDNQNGEKVEWQSLRGKIRVMAMVFTHCPSACPIITLQIKSAESRIPASAHGKVDYTLISFDAKRDTAARLREFYKEQHLDTNWQLLHGSADDVRTIAALLNVQYKEWPGGDFTHSDVTFVIDSNGHIVLRQEGIALQNPEVVAHAVTALLKTAF